MHQSHARMKPTIHREYRCGFLTQDLFQLAEDMGMIDRLRSIALGQGQGTIAATMIEKVKLHSAAIIDVTNRFFTYFFRTRERSAKARARGVLPGVGRGRLRTHRS